MVSDLYTHTITGEVRGSYGELLENCVVSWQFAWTPSGDGTFSLDYIPTGFRTITVDNPVLSYIDTTIYLQSDTFLIIQYPTMTPSYCNVDSIEYGEQWYHTVQLGEQCWLKENLNIGEFVMLADTGTNNGIIEKNCYDDNQAYCDTLGGLYHWGEIMQYTDIEGSQGICPDDWHVPTKYEWEILENFSDSTQINSALYLKDESLNGTNIYDFSVLKSGTTDYGYGWSELENAYYWTSTSLNVHVAYAKQFNFDINHIITNSTYKYYIAKALRCLKD